jgi:preprotein translocase subunit SecY
MVLTMTAGASLMIWMARTITDHGICNGIGVLIMTNSLARLGHKLLPLNNKYIEVEYKPQIILATIVLTFALMSLAIIIQQAYADIDNKPPDAGNNVGGQIHVSTVLRLRLDYGGYMAMSIGGIVASIPFIPLYVMWDITTLFNFRSSPVVVVAIAIITAFGWFIANYYIFSIRPENKTFIAGFRPGYIGAKKIRSLDLGMLMLGTFLALVCLLLVELYNFTPPLYNLFDISAILFSVAVILDSIRRLDRIVESKGGEGLFKAMGMVGLSKTDSWLSRMPW